MTARSPRRPALGTALALALLLAGPLAGQATPPVAEPDSIVGVDDRLVEPLQGDVEPGRFDGGRMWTFDNPPAEWFAEAYGIEADEAWFERARLGSIRIPGCSASFISAQGLVLTNHHCARNYVSQVDEGGEGLLDDGFHAATLEEERSIEGFTADQLIAIRDVTATMQDAVGDRTGPERQERLEERSGELEEEISEEFGGEEEGILAEVVTLYDGGRYSAYVFRRWTAAKLVFAPELQLGFFGGDPDNFTYPRYNLDFALLRIYDENDAPIESPEYFRWSLDGVSEGDPVFIVGNPGTTNRQQIVSQLLFRRDVEDRKVLSFVSRRAEVMAEVLENFPEVAETHDIRNDWFSAQNTIKSVSGTLEGLGDPVLLERKRRAQLQLMEAIDADPALAESYGASVAELRDIQDRKRALADGYGAFLGLTAAGFESPTLHRAILAFQVLNARQQGAPAEALSGLLAQIDSVGNAPAELDNRLIAARTRDSMDNYEVDEERWLRTILRGRTPEEAAAGLREGTILSDSAATVDALRTGRLDGNDPAIRFVALYVPAFAAFQGEFAQLSTREEELMAGLGRARFELYGWEVPPDATFTLRIADGVVQGYPYNGTRAPAFTSFYGLWDRNASFGEETAFGAWALPERWGTPPEGLDLATPLNFVSTVDITGGNSGSPVLNADLEIVGVVFDGNIESLPGDFIFLPERNRSVTVDARGILAALEHVYGAERIVAEIREAAAN